MRYLALASALLALASCSNSSGTASCTQTITTTSAQGSVTIHQCIEASNVSSDTLAQSQRTCVSSGDGGGTTTVQVFAEAPCDHTNSLGGCRTMNSSGTFTYWYYSLPDGGGLPLTTASVQSTCSSGGATYVAP